MVVRIHPGAPTVSEKVFLSDKKAPEGSVEPIMGAVGLSTVSDSFLRSFYSPMNLRLGVSG